MPRWLLALSDDVPGATVDYAANWLVADWYLDATGNDANNGLTPATALRTGQELARRLGPYAFWHQSVTVHIGANGISDSLALHGMMVQPGFLDIVGTPTVLASGTVATYSPLNHATPVATQVTVTGVADFSPYKWRRIRVTSGARADAVCWIARSNPGGLGVATARVSPPIQISTTSTTSITSDVALVPSDPVVIESLPVVGSISIILDGPVAVTPAVSQYSKRAISIRNIDTRFLGMAGTVFSLRQKTAVFGDRLGAIYIQQPNIVESNHVGGCNVAVVDTTTPASTPTLDAQASFNNCLFGDGTRSVQLVQPSYFNKCLFQETRFLGNRLNVQITGFDTQIFDCPSAASAMNHLFADMTNVSGDGNAGIGLNLNNGAFCRYAGTMNLKGATSDAQLTQAPAINLLLSQALQSDDYAQKGTAVLPGGATNRVTVTVPWYHQTIQQVTATHGVVAGTPGILSVDQISNTQFVITSSNSLDTSTVRWNIAPLGRSIYVTTQ